MFTYKSNIPVLFIILLLNIDFMRASAEDVYFGASSSSAAASSSSAAASSSSSKSASSDDEVMIKLQSGDGHTVMLPMEVATAYSKTIASILASKAKESQTSFTQLIKLDDLTGKQLKIITQLMVKADELSQQGIKEKALSRQLANLIKIDELIAIPQAISEVDIATLSSKASSKLAASIHTKRKFVATQKLPARLEQKIIDTQLINFILNGLFFLDAPVLIKAVAIVFLKNIDQTESTHQAKVTRKQNGLHTLAPELRMRLKQYLKKTNLLGYSIRELIKKGEIVTDNLIDRNISSLDGIELIPNSERIETLYLNNNNITVIPSEIKGFPRLKSLYLNNNNIAVIPPEIKGVPKLKNLHLSNNNIAVMPAEIKGLTKLERLYLDGNRITSIPAKAKGFHNLIYLVLNKNQISIMPTNLISFVNLKILNLAHNLISYMPSRIYWPPKLVHVNLEGNPIKMTLEEEEQLERSLSRTETYWPE